MRGCEPIGQSKDIILIVPAYNEEANIVHVIGSLRESGYAFVVINDGSTDATGALLDELNAPHVDLVENLGIGGAVQTGYKYALAHGYKIGIQFDGDGQHDVRYVDNLIQPLLNGEADIAVGSRFAGNESEFKSSLARRAGITLLSFTLKAISGKTIKDVTSGFRAANERAMQLFARSYPADYPEPESLAYAFAHGLTAAEVPVAMHERSGGESSIAGLDTVYYMVKVSISILISGSSKPSR